MDPYSIAGPNGVGKTTVAREVLPNYADCKNFVNADLIAQAMAPFSPETAAVRGGRMMLSEIRSFAKRRVSFAFETTLSGRSYMLLLRQLKAQGYEIHVFFLWVKTVDLALSRVRERVSRGGHDLPEAGIWRRVGWANPNFPAAYCPLGGMLGVFWNSGGNPAGGAVGEGTQGRRIYTRYFTSRGLT